MNVDFRLSPSAPTGTISPDKATAGSKTTRPGPQQPPRRGQTQKITLPTSEAQSTAISTTVHTVQMS